MSRMLGRATLTIPASPSTAVIAEAVATSFADEAGIPAAGVERLQRAIRCLVSFSVEQSYGGDSGGDVEISLELDTEGVVVDVHDWGKPFRRGGGPDGPLPAGLEDAEAVGESVRLINLANDGKRLTLHVATEHARHGTEEATFWARAQNVASFISGNEATDIMGPGPSCPPECQMMKPHFARPVTASV